MNTAEEQTAAVDDQAAGPAAEPILVSDVVRSDRALLARDAVKNHVIVATSVSLIPLPLVDLAAVMGLQVKLMHSLCKVYDVPFKEKLVRSLLTSLASGAGALVAMASLSSLAKAIPALGTLAGSAGMSATAAALTYATGQVFIQHFERGGTLLDFDPVKFKELFKAKVKEGAEVVKSIRPTAAAKATS